MQSFSLTTDFGIMVFEPILGNSFLVTLFPADDNLPTQFFDYNAGDLFVWENGWFNTNPLSMFFENLILFDIYDVSDIENIKNIISECLKWPEFYSCTV